MTDSRLNRSREVLVLVIDTGEDLTLKVSLTQVQRFLTIGSRYPPAQRSTEEPRITLGYPCTANLSSRIGS